MTILQAMRDRKLFGALFKDRATWHAWEVYLSALFGLPIAEADLPLFRACTGLEAGTATRARESFVICGRRSGKSFMSSIIAVYLAAFKDWKPNLSPGERGWIFVVANDKAQAQIIKRYISGILHANPLLAAKVQKETREEIELDGGIGIAVKTASFRTLRGYTLVAAILEELAYYRSDESANPDKELLAAVRPALATIPESVLLGISTPYNRTGVLWEQFKTNYGKEDGPLIWKAPTTTMNPTIDKRLIDVAIKEDPAAAKAEWECEWRDDVSAFISQELVEAVTVSGRHELPRVEGVTYKAFIDPSGGRQDSFTLAIAFRDELTRRIVLTVLREYRPPFQPEAVVSEMADLLKSYGISAVRSDRYSGEWNVAAFRNHGISVEASPMSASEIYVNFLPLIANGTVELLDNKRLAGQLVGLERKTRTGGRDVIDHYPGGHDDLAVAAAGAAVWASEYGEFRVWSIKDDFGGAGYRRPSLASLCRDATWRRN